MLHEGTLIRDFIIIMSVKLGCILCCKRMCNGIVVSTCYIAKVIVKFCF